MIYSFSNWITKPEAETLLAKYRSWKVKIELDAKVFLMDIAYGLNPTYNLIWYIKGREEVVVVWWKWHHPWSYQDFMESIKYCIPNYPTDLFQLL